MKPFLAVLFFAALIARLSGAPVNDPFAARLVIPATASGLESIASGDLTKATVETGEPSHADRVCTRSLWWTWTAPENGTLEITTQGSTVATTLAVYTGTQLAKLVVVAHDRDSGSSGSSLVRLSVQSGTAYQIAVADSAGSSGRVRLRLIHTTSIDLANDGFANRIRLAGGLTQATASNVEASKELGEPSHAGNLGGKSLWWTWTAPADGTVTLTTLGSTTSAQGSQSTGALDTLLAVYTGTRVSALTAVASNDNAPGNAGLHSVVSFYATQGTVYQIAVDGFRDPDTGAAEGTIALKLTHVRANDKFAARYSITTPSVIVTGASNTHATKETGEPAHAGNAGGKSVWWTWTAPSAGTVTLSTVNSTFDTLLAVYTGTSVGALVPVAQNDNAADNVTTSALTFTAVSGQRYQIAVDGKDGAGGTIALNLQFASDFPAISVQPTGKSVVAGGSATFTLTATGKAPLTYTWQRRLAGAASSAWTALPAQESPELMLTDIPQSANGDAFRCLVSNAAGTVTSTVVTLKVTPLPPAIALPALLRVRGAVSLPSAPAGAPAALKYYASSLPPGLTIDRDTGLITGTITKAGTFVVTYWTQDGQVKSVLQTVTFQVEAIPTSMVGAFEGLLIAGDEDTGLPAGKVALKVSTAGTFTGTLVTTDVKTFSLKGALALNDDFSAGTATLTIKRNATETYTLVFSLASAPVFSAELREGETVKAATAAGVKLAVTTAAPGAGSYTTTLLASPLEGVDTPAYPPGAGYSTATLAASGLLKLSGKLSDGVKFTASLSSGSDATYRLYAKPYKTVGNSVAGVLPLTARTDDATLYHIVTDDVYWTKPANPKDKTYPAGFGPLGVSFVMEPWVKPASLGVALGLAAEGVNYPFTVAVSEAGVSNAEPNDRALPTELLFTPKNTVSVPLPNPTALSIKISKDANNRPTGVFTGSFILSDLHPTTGKLVKRKITINGVLQQLPAGEEDEVFGRGYFLVPPVVKGDPTLSGLIEFAP